MINYVLLHGPRFIPKVANQRLYRIMKLIAFCLLIGSLHLSGKTRSQTITLDVTRTDIKQVFRAIENQTGYAVLYSDESVAGLQPLSINVNKMPLETFLKTLLKPALLDYQIDGTSIFIRPKRVPHRSSVMTTGNEPTEAPQHSVQGTVTTDNGQPLTGVTVALKGTSMATITDSQGNYRMVLPEGDGKLLFTAIGFKPVEKAVGSQSRIDVLLEPLVSDLDEVVIVGYGTQRKSDVTGAISVVTAKDMVSGATFNALQGLKGKAAGVNIFSNTGNPFGVNGSAPRVVIRGMNSINTSTNPLYVVDGVQMDNIQFVNPNDIERIEVLKDASATAIYGARGANGVILVTTKRGNSGAEGTVVSYNNWVSMGLLSKEIEVMDAYEFMEMEDRAFANIGKYPQGQTYLSNNGITELLVDRSDPLLFDEDGNPRYNTNWQREATRNAFSHSHQINIQHQGQKSSTGAFINYTDQQGILLNNYAKRASARFTNDAKPLDWLDINSNVLINHTWANSIDDVGGGLTARRTIWEMLPILPVKFPDGSWSSSQFTGNKLNLAQEAMTNPVHELTERVMNRYRTKLFGNLAFNLTLAEGLNLRTQFGVDANISSNKDYIPNNMINISTRGAAGISHSEQLYWQEETYLTYDKLFNSNHRLNATLGLSWSQSNTTGDNTGTVQDFENNYFSYHNLGAGTTPSAPSSSFSSWSMNSYFARASYALKEKYLATFTIRSDGSSRFGANNKYAFFPSAGLGWVVSSENFMAGVGWINQLKLRTSYGRTGNTEISPYSTLATMNSSTILLGGNRAAINQMSRMPNPDLEWEKTDQFDVGFDLIGFDNRVNLEVDYYYKKTSDLLLARPLPLTTGFSSVMDNIGRVDNSGIDFLLTTKNIEHENFRWETTLNLNYNENVIKKLGENNEDILTAPSFVGGNIILRVGHPLSSFYGYERLGTWGTDEANEAAKVNAVPGEAKRSAERKIIGNGMPKFTGSFVHKFYVGNVDLIVDLQFVAGVDTWQLHYHTSEDRTGYINGLKSILYDSWTETNQNTMVQQIRHRVYAGHNTTADSRWVSDGSYLRGNLVQLGYTFNDSKLQRHRIKGLRIHASVNNAFLIHSRDFKGYDPEGASNTDQFGQNVFFYQYPTARVFSIGVNFSF